MNTEDAWKLGTIERKAKAEAKERHQREELHAP